MVRQLSRRAQAQLRVARAPKASRHAWRDLRRAVAPLRDRDVTGAHLLAGLRDLGVHRAERNVFRDEWAAARGARLGALTLPALPPKVKRPRHVKARARKRLKRDAGALLREGDGAMDSEHADVWHAWRKHLKQYRYTLALLGKPPPALIRVLQALGQMQDARTVHTLLSTEGWLPAHRGALLAREEQAQSGAQARARRSWPALRRYLASQFNRAD